MLITLSNNEVNSVSGGKRCGDFVYDYECEKKNEREKKNN
jgi:hypothetical protein